MTFSADSEARLARMTAGIDAIVDPDRPQRERRHARAAGAWLALGAVGLSAAVAAAYYGAGRVDAPEARVAVPAAQSKPKSFFAALSGSEPEAASPTATPPAPRARALPPVTARAEGSERNGRAWRPSAREAAERFRLPVEDPDYAAPDPRRRWYDDEPYYPPPWRLREWQEDEDDAEAAVPLRGRALDEALARDRERTRRWNRRELDRLPEPEPPDY